MILTTRCEFMKLAGAAVGLAASAAQWLRSTPAAAQTGGGHGWKTSEPQPGQAGRAMTARITSSAALQRADALLRQVTLEEKAMQLSCVVPLARGIKSEERAFLSVATVASA